MQVGPARSAARLDVDPFIQEAARVTGESLHEHWRVTRAGLGAVGAGIALDIVVYAMAGLSISPFVSLQGPMPWWWVVIALGTLSAALLGLVLTAQRYRRVLVALAAGGLGPARRWSSALEKDLRRWLERRELRIPGPGGLVPPPAEVERALTQIRVARESAELTRRLLLGQAVALLLGGLLIGPLVALFVLPSFPLAAPFAGPVFLLFGSEAILLALAGLWYSREGARLSSIEERLRTISARAAGAGLRDRVDLLEPTLFGQRWGL